MALVKNHVTLPIVCVEDETPECWLIDFGPEGLGRRWVLKLDAPAVYEGGDRGEPFAIVTRVAYRQMANLDLGRARERNVDGKPAATPGDT